MAVEDFLIVTPYNGSLEFYITDDGKRVFQSMFDGRFYEHFDEGNNGDVLYVEVCNEGNKHDDNKLFFHLKKATSREAARCKGPFV